jgi:hypothetical protein
VLALALTASLASPTAEALAALKRLLRVANWSLLVMLLSGIGLLYASQWTLAQTGWFRVGFVLYIALGPLLGISQARLRKALANATLAPAAMRRVSTLMWVASALVAVVVVLMVAKPF